MVIEKDVDMDRPEEREMLVGRLIGYQVVKGFALYLDFDEEDEQEQHPRPLLQLLVEPIHKRGLRQVRMMPPESDTEMLLAIEHLQSMMGETVAMTYRDTMITSVRAYRPSLWQRARVLVSILLYDASQKVWPKFTIDKA